MKLLYTDTRTSLTEILTKEAQGLVDQGKRVFYIAPNSLSFEKERAVLESAGFFCDYSHALRTNGSLFGFKRYTREVKSR